MGSMTKPRSPKWTKDRLTKQLITLCAPLGRFPSQLECRDWGLSGFYAALNRNGGLRSWWEKMEKLGFPHSFTDKEFGRNGEMAVKEILVKHGFNVIDHQSTSCHYDLLVDGVIRIDVKTTGGRVYNNQEKAWYFRIGKMPTVDIVALYKLDLGDVFFIPWFLASSSNMSLGNESEYDAFKNNFGLLKSLSKTRQDEHRSLIHLMKSKRASHLAAVVQLRETGKSYREIGRFIGCSAQHVQRLLRQAKEYKKQGWI